MNFLVLFNPDESAPFERCGDKKTSAPKRIVEHDVPFPRKHADEIPPKSHRLLRRVPYPATRLALSRFAIQGVGWKPLAVALHLHRPEIAIASGVLRLPRPLVVGLTLGHDGAVVGLTAVKDADIFVLA